MPRYKCKCGTIDDEKTLCRKCGNIRESVDFEVVPVVVKKPKTKKEKKVA
jgi:hypothetical protein